MLPKDKETEHRNYIGGFTLSLFIKIIRTSHQKDFWKKHAWRKEMERAWKQEIWNLGKEAVQERELRGFSGREGEHPKNNFLTYFLWTGSEETCPLGGSEHS